MYGLSSNIHNIVLIRASSRFGELEFCVGWSHPCHRSRDVCASILLAQVPTDLDDSAPIHVSGMYILMIL
jgi:hypothetical protein